MKKAKKIAIYAAYITILITLLSSCAIDKKCPAYTELKINSELINV